MPFEPKTFLDEQTNTFTQDRKSIPGRGWLPVNQHNCGFQPEHFVTVALNLIKNPNINSSHLFRADILYDSQDTELTEPERSGTDAVRPEAWIVDEYTGLHEFETKRCIVRQLIPRNPQLDRPIAQTCLILDRHNDGKCKEIIVILVPHVSRVNDLPWYHPGVRALAYWYEAPTSTTTLAQSEAENTGKISVHYQLFPGQSLPLDKRLLRIAYNLLQVVHKHGRGSSAGYEKKSHHDQLISQKRVQDTYTELKAKHAKRLCSAWVEQTEPSKHVFEDLGIAAFLIELWKEMYAPPGNACTKDPSSLPAFPGFIDIGCGNGVLTEVLILSGYHGEGYDARRRKTWSILSPKAQNHLHERICVPQPLFDLYPASPSTSKPSLLARARSILNSTERPPVSALAPPRQTWHNGLPAIGTFIISNHADELTPWTPLLACLSASPFLAIPCCSHNLSGARFRAPTAYNAYSADAAAPGYFAAQKKPGAKSIAITIPTQAENEDGEGSEADGSETRDDNEAKHSIFIPKEEENEKKNAPETGSLRALAPANRAKQPSAYSSLCDWVSHLGRAAGYVMERDMLRIPSTRNIGLVGRVWAAPEAAETGPDMTATEDDWDKETVIRDVARSAAIDNPTARAARTEHVRRIVIAEGADGHAWVRRCDEVLAKGGGVISGRE